MRFSVLLSALALFPGWATFGCGSDECVHPKVELRGLGTVSLGTLSRDVIAGSAVASADGCHVAFAAIENAKVVVLRDGKSSGLYESAVGLAFSPDGQHLAHVATTREGTCLVLDGREGQLFDSAGQVTWSPNSIRCAFVASRGDKWFVVVRDGDAERLGAPFAGIVDGSLTCSLDGRRWAYVVQRGDRQAAVVDSAAGPEYGAILGGRVVFSSDSRRFAYVGLQNPASVRGVLVIDGTEQGDREVAITETFPFAFSQDGQAWGFVSARDGKFVVVAQNDKERTETKSHDWIADLAFLPTGHGLIYIAQEADRMFVVSNGREGPHHDGKVLSLKVSPDGTRLTYIVERAGRQRIVLDEQQHTEYDAVLAESIVFSPNGKSLIYAYKKANDYHLVLCRDDRTQSFGPYKALGRAMFSPDGMHFAFSFARDGALGVAVDGSESRGPIAVVNAPVFDSEDSVRFVAISDGNFVSQRLGLSSAKQPSETEAVAKQPRNTANRLATVDKALTDQGVEAAVEAASRVIAADPSNGEALYARGQLYLELKRVDLAYEDFRQLLVLQPGNAKTLVACGRAAECLRQYNDAVEHYNRALGSSPKCLEALAHRGSILAALNKPDLAKRDLALSFNVPGGQAERQAVALELLRTANWAVDRAGTVRRQQAGNPDIEWQHARVLTSQAFGHARTAFPSTAERLQAVMPFVERILQAIFRAGGRDPLVVRDIGPLQAFDEASYRRLEVEIARQRTEKKWRGRFLNLALHVAIWAYSGAQSNEFAELGPLIQSIGQEFGDAGIARLGRDISAKEFEPDPGPDLTLSLRKALVVWPWIQANEEKNREQLNLRAIENWSPVFGEELEWEDWVERDAEHSRALLRRNLAEVGVEVMELRAAMLLPEYPDVTKILNDSEKERE